MTPAQLRTRRYYLHRRVKRTARIAVGQKTVFVPAHIGGGVMSKYALELRDRFGYVIQLEII